MQTTYRFKAKEIGMAFIKSLKTLFADQEVEIIVKSVSPDPEKDSRSNKGILQMIEDNRKKAPIISSEIDIRRLIDDAHYSS